MTRTFETLEEYVLSLQHGLGLPEEAMYAIRVGFSAGVSAVCDYLEDPKLSALVDEAVSLIHL